MDAKAEEGQKKKEGLGALGLVARVLVSGGGLAVLVMLGQLLG